MPIAICKGCGRLTNSATSNWWNTKDLEPTKCYVAWVDGKPVKGCGFDNASDFDKANAMSIITGKDISKFIKRKTLQ